MTTQPSVSLETYEDDGLFWVDIDSDDGAFLKAALSSAKSEGAAWRRAAKVLRRLADEAEKAGG